MGVTVSKDIASCDDVKFLCSTAQPGADVDIVVLRVLSQSNDDSLRKPDHHWSHDCLYPEELNSLKSRILVYGHNIDLSLFYSNPQAAQNVLTQQALRLLQLLLHHRNTWKVHERPIIFIAHGVAGMVIEKAIDISIGKRLKLSWNLQHNPLIHQITNSVYIFSHDGPLGWTPQSWHPLKPHMGTGFEDVEQNRADINALTPSSPPPPRAESRKLRCLHHARFQKFMRGTVMHLLALFALLAGQGLLVADVLSLLARDAASGVPRYLVLSKVEASSSLSVKINALILRVAPALVLYLFYAYSFFMLRVRDRYQARIGAGMLGLGILVAQVPYLKGEGVWAMGIVGGFLTGGLVLSAVAHWMWPVWLTNEEGKVRRVLEAWVVDVCAGGEGFVDAVEEKEGEIV